jgi:hypothetical protein
MENLHVTPPPALGSENENFLDFPPQIHGQNVTRSTTFPASQSNRGQPWSSGSWGWHRSPQDVQAQPSPLQRLPLLPHSSHHHLHRASPATFPMPQGRNGCLQDPVRYLPPPSPASPLPEMVDQKLWKFHPQHMNCEQKFQKGTVTTRRTIWGWQCEECTRWWRTTGRVRWEESEFEAGCNFENERCVEICGKCRGHFLQPETRSTE